MKLWIATHANYDEKSHCVIFTSADKQSAIDYVSSEYPDFELLTNDDDFVQLANGDETEEVNIVLWDVE